MPSGHPTARDLSPAWFFLTLVGVYGSAALILLNLPSIAHANTVLQGLTVDLVVVVPLAYYWLLVRTRGWPIFSVVPCIVLSLAVAGALIPGPHQGTLRAMKMVLPLLEVAALAYASYLGHRLTTTFRARTDSSGDFHDALRGLLRDKLPIKLADAVAYEISIFRYACGPSIRPPQGGHHSYHRKSGYAAVLAAIGIAGAVEMVGVHFLLWQWSATAAIVHLGLSLYGLMWVAGDYRAMKARPILIDSETITLRCGLRWQAVIPRDLIVDVRRNPKRASAEGRFHMVPIGDPKLELVLGRKVVVSGPYGLKKSASRIGISVDDQAAFLADLASGHSASTE